MLNDTSKKFVSNNMDYIVILKPFYLNKSFKYLVVFSADLGSFLYIIHSMSSLHNPNSLCEKNLTFFNFI